VNQAALVARIGGAPLPDGQFAFTRLAQREGKPRPARGRGRSVGGLRTDAAFLQALVKEHPRLNEPLHPSLPYRGAEVVWAVRQEMARTVEDVLSRRTRALLLDARAARRSLGRCSPHRERTRA